MHVFVSYKHENVDFAENVMSRYADICNNAVQALGEIKDPSAVPALIGALRDPYANIRNNAVQALGEIKDPSAVPALIGTLLDPDLAASRSAAEL